MAKFIVVNSILHTAMYVSRHSFAKGVLFNGGHKKVTFFRTRKRAEEAIKRTEEYGAKEHPGSATWAHGVEFIVRIA